MMRSTSLLLAGLFLFGLTSCSSDSPTGPGGATPNDIDAIVMAAGRVVPAEADKDEITGVRDEEQGDYQYTYETHDVVDNVESIAYLGLNDDVIWPGSFVRGDQIASYVYEPITLPRKPVTLSVSLETSSTGSSITQDVADPKLSTVRQGISDLLKAAIVGDTHVPAKVEFYHQQIFSQSQMNLFVGADVSYGVGDLSTAFNWSSTEQKTKIVAKYKQIYYSIDMDYPQRPSDLLADGLTADELKAALPPGSHPLYVAGVSYGLMALMTIETSFSYDEMNAAIDAAYNGLVDVQITSQYTAKEMLQNSSVRIVIYGGSTAGLGDIENGFEGFMKVVEASKDFTSESPGVPLVYKFRHAADNTLAAVTLTSQYTLVRPLKLRQRVRLTVDKFVCEMADDEGAYNDPDMDRFQVKASAYQRATEGSSEVAILEGQSVYYWSTPGEHTMGRGDEWVCQGQHTWDFVFDTKNYDFDLARMYLWGWARDYDTTSSNENGYGQTNIFGNQFFESGGKHTFLIDSSDFRFRVEVTLDALN